MGRKRKGKSAINAQRKQSSRSEPEEVVKAPHTFVVHKGLVGKTLLHLKTDVRKVMEPYTASRLKVKKNTSVKDFVSIAGLLNVTHLISLTKTKLSSYVRFCRLPRGPTVTFRINEFTLSRDVTSSLKRPISLENLFTHHPFLVLNNFTGEGMHMKLMATIFQNMFPSINVNKVNLNRVRRCVLFNYNSDTNLIEFRHYAIKIVPCGLSRGAKKLTKKKVPNLSQFGDVTELMTKGGLLSDSEAEMDGPHNEVTLPHRVAKRRKMASQKSAIRLIELGPRLTLKLVKIEEGLMKGDVLYDEEGSAPKTSPEAETEPVEAKKAKLC